jgi:glycosyltransferase involved in cell wall biosynthesis
MTIQTSDPLPRDAIDQSVPQDGRADAPPPAPMRVLLIAGSASFRYGGEAVLPLHYFRCMRARQLPVWMITNARSRHELSQKLSPHDLARIYFLTDTRIHRIFATIAGYLPTSIAAFTLAQFLEILDQWRSRRLARKLIPRLDINLIHQPIPVSPKQVSAIHGLGVPVIIGPMNGGINFPRAFASLENPFDRIFVTLGRALSGIANRLIPGKLKAAALLVANQRTRDALPHGVSGKVKCVVENGVDLTLYRSALPKNSTLDPASAVCFVFVGRLIRLKGVNLLLHAAAKARTQANIHLKIIGEGPCRQELQRLTTSLNLQSLVSFDGWLSQPECAAALARADAFVLPSLRECGGAVVLEAMAMRLPVIAANWGGPADYIDSSCGFPIDVLDPAQFVDNLAAAMVQLSKSPELRKTMGQAGYEKVVEKYDWERKLDAMLHIYRELLPDTASPGSPTTNSATHPNVEEISAA